MGELRQEIGTPKPKRGGVDDRSRERKSSDRDHRVERTPRCPLQSDWGRAKPAFGRDRVLESAEIENTSTTSKRLVFSVGTSFKSGPHPPLLAPIKRLGDWSHICFLDCIPAVLGRRQEEDLLLEIRGQIQECHDLGHSCRGNSSKVGEFRLVGDTNAFLGFRQARNAFHIVGQGGSNLQSGVVVS